MSAIRDRAARLDRSPITINGHPLSHFGCLVTDEGWDWGEAKPITSTLDIPGRAAVDTTVTEPGTDLPALGRRTITIHIATVGDPDEIREAQAAIGAIAGGQDCTVGSSEMHATWRGRLSVGAWTMIGRRAATATLTVDADPLARLPQQTVDVLGVTLDSAPHEQIVWVDGNRPVLPTIVMHTGAQAATYVWTVNGVRQEAAAGQDGEPLWTLDTTPQPLQPGRNVLEINDALALTHLTLTFSPLLYI